MKILNMINDYTRINESYRNRGNARPGASPEQPFSVKTHGQQEATPAVVPSTVLSTDELQTLKAVFGAERPTDFMLYGSNPLQQSTAGHLLDIRG